MRNSKSSRNIHPAAMSWTMTPSHSILASRCQTRNLKLVPYLRKWNLMRRDGKRVIVLTRSGNIIWKFVPFVSSIEYRLNISSQVCIVRIMKGRRHLAHNDLVNEVTNMLLSRFQPEPLAIKRRIENLIEVCTLVMGWASISSDPFFTERVS